MSFLCITSAGRAQRQKYKGERTDDDTFEASQLIELLRRPGDLFFWFLSVKEVLLSVVTFIKKQYHWRSVRFLTILMKQRLLYHFTQGCVQDRSMIPSSIDRYNQEK